MLSTSAVLGLLLTPLLAQQPVPDRQARHELQRLQGGWEVESAEEEGKKLTADELKQRSVFFGRDSFILRQGNEVMQVGLLQLDPSRKPKTFNAFVVQGNEKGKTLLGIYARDDDKLKICVDTRGEARPKDFSTSPDSGQLLLVCNRMKSSAHQPDLSGVYRSESTELDGSRHVADAVFERMGDAYVVTYKKNNAVAFIGVGILKGNIFCMSWISQGQVGITMYEIETEQRLVGQYTRLGGPGILSREVLTRKDFD